MAKLKNEKVEETNQEPGSSDVLAGMMKETKGRHFNDIIPENILIPTGSLTLDALVKIRTGSIIRLAALCAESGKTSEGLLLIKNFFEECPKGKALYVKAEGRLGQEIRERSGLIFVNTPEEWVYGTVFVFSINIFEDVAETITQLSKTMHAKGEKFCFMIDSLDGLMLRADSEKSLWTNKEGQKIAGVPLLMKLFFKTMSLPIAHYDVLGIITSQYTANIQIDPYTQSVRRQVSGSGGSSVGHQADYVFEYLARNQSDYILEDQKAKPDPIKNKVLGVYVTIDIKKSGTDVTGTKVKVPIKKGRVGNCVWVEKELADLILSFQLVTVKGSWLRFDTQIIEEAAKQGIVLKEQIQGINQLYDYLESDKAILNFFLAKIKAAIS